MPVQPCGSCRPGFECNGAAGVPCLGGRRATNGHVDDPARQCIGKNRWDTKRGAKRSLARMVFGNHPGGQRRDQLHPYHCPHCGGYHIGTKPQFSYKKGAR